MGKGYKLSSASMKRLQKVHPDLQRVVSRALEISPVDFAVVQGARTLDEQKRLYGKGRTGAQCEAAGVPATYARPGERKVTWTLRSNHLINPRTGYGHAVDVCPLLDGKLEWDDDGKLFLWPKVAEAFKKAAEELGVSIEWGGDWKKNIDRPHFELA